MASETMEETKEEVWRKVVNVTTDCVIEKSPSDEELAVYLEVFNEYKVPYRDINGFVNRCHFVLNNVCVCLLFQNHFMQPTNITDSTVVKVIVPKNSHSQYFK